MSGREFYIKGYKIDYTKIEQTYGRRPDDPENTRFAVLWEKFPLPFKDIETGKGISPW